MPTVIDTLLVKEKVGSAELLSLLLRNRGVAEEEKVSFLYPNYEAHTHDPFLLKNMERAVLRVLTAIKNGERIVAYTDYDTDGIPAGVIFHDFFKKIGYENFENYIPHRHNEGFGVNIGAVEGLAERGAKLLVTADCGIADVVPVGRAKELGMDVIITDHHLPGDEMPPAYAIVNPKQDGDEYPFKELCGAAVAWKLVCAVIKRGNEEGVFSIHDGWEKWLLDMVGIATVSDMVLLRDENRALAHYGLMVLRRSRRAGLLELFRKLYVRQSNLTEDDIGFVIGPRINVASRMDSPEKAFRLLATEDKVEAVELVRFLESLNNKRKGYVAAIVKDARARFREDTERKVIVLGDTAWQPGVLGLAANTLMREFERPVFLWGEGGDGTLKGSCRSDGSVHLHELMAEAKDVLVAYGGHAYSGGFSVARERLHIFKDTLEEAMMRVEKKEVEEKTILDGALSLDDVSREVYGIIERLAPFGEGNPKPLFKFEDVRVHGVNWFGKQKNHAKLMFRNSFGNEIEAIQFFANADVFGAISVGDTMTFTAHIERNTFGRQDSLRLRIVEM